jgi:hypothetical protein
MPRLELSVPHCLSRDEAVQRAHSWFDGMAEQHQDSLDQFEVAWHQSTARFTARAHGIKVTGQVAVRADAVEVDAALPLLAAPFKSQIANLLSQSLRRELR